MDDAWAETEEPCPGPDRHIFGGQFRMVSVFAGLSSYPTARATDNSIGLERGPLFGFSLCVVLGW